MSERAARGIRQLKRDYSILFAQREEFAHGLARKYAKLMEVEGSIPKIERLIGYLLRQIMQKAAHTIVAKEHFENALSGWETSDASKRPLPH